MVYHKMSINGVISGMKHLSTRIMLLCGITLGSLIAHAQPTPEEIRAKEVDGKIEAIKSSKPGDSIILAADDIRIKGIQSQSTSVKGYWYNGSLQQLETCSIDASGNKWEVHYYFTDTALFHIVTDFYTVQTFISPDFFVWQFQKAFYLKKGAMYYYKVDGTDRGMPPEYEDMALMQTYAKKYYAALVSAKK
jgi:hypothetical protein